MPAFTQCRFETARSPEPFQLIRRRADDYKPLGIHMLVNHRPRNLQQKTTVTTSYFALNSFNRDKSE